LSKDAAAGFSLVEMLVVVAVVSVLAVGATLPLARTAPSTGSEAAKLVEAVERLRTLSILSDATHAISFDSDGWASQRIAPGQALTSVPGLEHRTQSRLTVPAGPDGTNSARMLILPDGSSTPVQLRLDGDGGPVVCRSSGAGDLSCRPG
jgi:prepilin-type N-terminal cleavage/methylation domain-containing protein